MSKELSRHAVARDVLVACGLVFLHGLVFNLLGRFWLGLQEYGWTFPEVIAMLPFLVLALLVGCALALVTASRVRVFLPVPVGIYFGASYAWQSYSSLSRASGGHGIETVRALGFTYVALTLFFFIAPIAGFVLVNRTPHARSTIGLGGA